MCAPALSRTGAKLPIGSLPPALTDHGAALVALCDGSLLMHARLGRMAAAHAAVHAGPGRPKGPMLHQTGEMTLQKNLPHTHSLMSSAGGHDVSRLIKLASLCSPALQRAM